MREARYEAARSEATDHQTYPSIRKVLFPEGLNINDLGGLAELKLSAAMFNRTRDRPSWGFQGTGFQHIPQ